MCTIAQYITYNVVALVGFSLQLLLVPGQGLCTRSTLVVNSLLNRQRNSDNLNLQIYVIFLTLP